MLRGIPREEKERGIMQEDGIPNVALIAAAMVIIIGIVVAFSVITWVFLLA